MEHTHLVACYGSLKKGFYNHRVLGDAEFLGTSAVEGVMYWNGSYPKLYHPVVINNEMHPGPFGEDLQKEHELEVYRVSDMAYMHISNMEIGAGYVEEQITTPYGDAAIYYMPHNRFTDEDDWIPGYTRELLDSKNRHVSA